MTLQLPHGIPPTSPRTKACLLYHTSFICLMYSLRMPPTMHVPSQHTSRPFALSNRYSHDPLNHLIIRLQQYMRHIPMVPLPEIPYRHKNRQPTRHQARIIHAGCIDRHRIGRAVNHVEDNYVRAHYAGGNVPLPAMHSERAWLDVLTVEEDVR